VKHLKLLAIVSIIAVVSSVLALSFLGKPREIVAGHLDVKGMVVYAIGESTPTFEKFTEALEIKGAKVNYLELPPNATDLSEEMFVLFDGGWIEERVKDPNLHAFLRNAASRRVKLVAVGGNTSKFFEALYEAGVIDLATECDPECKCGCDFECGCDEIIINPAYMNPPLVGYRMKEVEGPYGPYLGESLLFSNTNNVDVLIEALSEWGA